MQPKITQYGICAAHTDGELAHYVNAQLKKGFQPYGFVFTSMQGDCLFFHQAMVRTSAVKKLVKKISSK